MRLTALILILCLSAGCRIQTTESAIYTEFITDFHKTEIQFLDRTIDRSVQDDVCSLNDYDYLECTKDYDIQSDEEKIRCSLDLIRSILGEDFYNEAMHQVNEIIVSSEKPDWSAQYEPDTYNIIVFEQLFAYGCTQEVAATLIHEMAHAIQDSRYQKPGYQPGEHKLRQSSYRERLILEIEANAFQMEMSKKYNLMGVDHTAYAVELENAFRTKYREMIIADHSSE